MKGDKLTDRWGTPWSIIRALEKELKIKFTLDPAALPETAKAKKFFTPDDDGLKQRWSGHIFLNPPYSAGQIKRWLAKAIDELPHCKSITVLLTNDSSTGWYINAFSRAIKIIYVSPRIQFIAPPGLQSSSNRYTSHIFHFRPGKSGPPEAVYLPWDGNA
jgi:phage N-6-adenine-methyltransferase